LFIHDKHVAGDRFRNWGKTSVCSSAEDFHSLFPLDTVRRASSLLNRRIMRLLHFFAHFENVHSAVKCLRFTCVSGDLPVPPSMPCSEAVQRFGVVLVQAFGGRGVEVVALEEGVQVGAGDADAAGEDVAAG
jgi:hypothetical protein